MTGLRNMNFFFNINFRGLAARNCLVRVKCVENINKITVKIGELGLQKPNSSEQIYKIKSRKPLPVRWMAPESLDQRIFTNKSDVW